MDQPEWLAAAWAEFGVREKPGTANAAAVLEYFAEAGHAQIRSDATPWCAAFAGAMLKRAGRTASGSLMARSYLKWGDAIDQPRLGAIAVLTRGRSASAGHVGFYLGHAGGRVFLLGGNQSDAVTVEAFDRKRVLGYRWPPAAAAVASEAAAVASAAVGKRSDIYERALTHVLKMEGGFSDDFHDPGGPTNKGITLAVFAKWRGSAITAQSRKSLIAALKTIDDATVNAIYLKRYWQPASCEDMPDAVAVMQFDAAVNHGVGTAIRVLQSALRVKADGAIGPQTRAALQAADLPQLIARYADLRRKRYRSLPHFWRFGRGWLRRVDATEGLALALAVARSINPTLEKGELAMSDTFKFPRPGEIPGEPMAGDPMQASDGKWWGHSKTVWGALITTLATVLPVLGPLFGLSLPADVIMQIGNQTMTVIQAVAGLFGTLLTLYGRSTASVPLMRRDVNLRM